jgi:hypothetical protein
MRHYAEGETMKRVIACLGIVCYTQAHVSLDTIEKKEFAQTRLAHMQSLLTGKQHQEQALVKAGAAPEKLAKVRSAIHHVEEQIHIAQNSFNHL